MKFAHPEILALAALLIPALGAFLIWAWRHKQKLVAQFVQSRLLAHLTIGVSQARQKLRLLLLFLAASFALLAAARPQWGFSWEETAVQGLDIIVAIDTSKSMLAEDISPNRLMRAKLAAYDLVNIAKSDRFGLIAFAGTAFLQCPLTLDEQAFRQSVESLDVNIIPQGGTAVSGAIEEAIKAFEKSENHKVLVLFTDGEDHDEEAVNAAEKAAKAEVKLFTIGIGTREGEMLRMRDERGNQVFLKDDKGNAIKSRLNESLLQQIATKGNGFYLPLVGTTAMETLYNKGLASLPRGESTSKLVKNYRERFYFPLVLSIALLLLETFLPQRRRPRSSQSDSTSNLKKVAAVICLLLAPTLASASPTSAQKKYEAGKFDEAFTAYQELLAKKTNDFRLHYNAGDAAYQSKEFDIARKHFETATVAPDLELQQKAYYNLGNTLYQIGEPSQDPKQKQEAWELALKNYENALKLNAKDVDANNNLTFVKQRLEELKQQQQQQQQQKQDQSKDDQKDDKQNQDQQKQDSGKNDQQKQDQQQQQQNSDQQKQDQQNQQGQDQAQKDQQQQQKEQEKQQAQNNQGKEDEKKEGQSGKPGEEQDAEEQEGEMAAADGKMTEGQAQQFLEALKREEKPLIFRPPPKERKNPNQPFKDW